MSLGDAVLTFLSVFVAALLAFYLDGLRERRATRAWVREYLGFWRGLLESTAGEGAANEAGFRTIDGALGGWLSGGAGSPPTWDLVDAINVNAAVRFTPALLGAGGRAIAPELMQKLFVADALAPALQTRADFVQRLFETEIRPRVLDQVLPLDGRARRAVELYRRELAGLADQMRDYTTHLRDICDDLVRLGF